MLRRSVAPSPPPGRQHEGVGRSEELGGLEVLIEDPIENQGRDPPAFSNYYNSFLAPTLYVVREKGGGRRGDPVCCGEPGG